MGEEPEDLTRRVEELVTQGEELILAENVDKFLLAVERVGFKYGNRLDAIAMLSLGIAAMHEMGKSYDQILKHIQLVLLTREKEDGENEDTKGIQQGSGSEEGCKDTTG